MSEKLSAGYGCAFHEMGGPSMARVLTSAERQLSIHS